MKFYVNESELYSHKLKRDYTICLISDIHNTKYSSYKMWNMLIERIKDINPDYIVIAGDIIYYADDLLVSKTKDKLDYLLANLLEIAPIITVFGNHDLKDGSTLKYEDTVSYFKELEQNSNGRFSLCENDILALDDISFIGVTPPFDSYYFTHEDEWIELFTKTIIDNFHDKELSNTFNILVTHSPLTLYKLVDNESEYTEETIKFLREIQLFLCGHIHDGLIPKWMQRLGMFKDTGIMFSEGNGLKDITVRKVKCAKGMQNIFNGEMIVSAGITKWCQPNPLFGAVDKILAKDIDVIKLKKR